MRCLLMLCVPLLAAAGTCELPVAKPEEMGLRSAAVLAVVNAAHAAGTDGLVILKDGKYVGGFGEHQVRYLYSISKTLTSLAVGEMFTQGKWSSVDVPIGQLLPELAKDPKGEVTLRQLMSHTSGIRDARDANGHVLREWNYAKDWLVAAEARPMAAKPGTVFSYNNVGPVLVAGAVERAAGERLDKLVARTIFKPLCIEHYQWQTDKAGHAGAYTGVSLAAMDVAKLGQLVLDKGMWQGTRVLSEEWMRLSAYTSSQTVHPGIGLIWFLQPDARFPMPYLINHNGDGGQNLLIFPNQGIVVARVRLGGAGDASKNMSNLPQLVSDQLVKPLMESQKSSGHD